MNLIWSVERKPGGNNEAIQFFYKPENNIIIEVEFFSPFLFFAHNLKMEKNPKEFGKITRKKIKSQEMQSKKNQQNITRSQIEKNHTSSSYFLQTKKIYLVKYIEMDKGEIRQVNIQKKKHHHFLSLENENINRQ